MVRRHAISTTYQYKQANVLSYSCFFLHVYLFRKNNVHVAVIDKRSGFPVELLEQITGEKLLTDMAPMVSKKTSWCSRCLYNLKGFSEFSVIWEVWIHIATLKTPSPVQKSHLLKLICALWCHNHEYTVNIYTLMMSVRCSEMWPAV